MYIGFGRQFDVRKESQMHSRGRRNKEFEAATDGKFAGAYARRRFIGSFARRPSASPPNTSCMQDRKGDRKRIESAYISAIHLRRNHLDVSFPFVVPVLQFRSLTQIPRSVSPRSKIFSIASSFGRIESNRYSILPGTNQQLHISLLPVASTATCYLPVDIAPYINAFEIINTKINPNARPNSPICLHFYC